MIPNRETAEKITGLPLEVLRAINPMILREVLELCGCECEVPTDTALTAVAVNNNASENTCEVTLSSVYPFSKPYAVTIDGYEGVYQIIGGSASSEKIIILDDIVTSYNLGNPTKTVHFYELPTGLEQVVIEELLRISRAGLSSERQGSVSYSYTQTDRRSLSVALSTLSGCNSQSAKRGGLVFV